MSTTVKSEVLAIVNESRKPRTASQVFQIFDQRHNQNFFSPIFHIVSYASVRGRLMDLVSEGKVQVAGTRTNDTKQTVKTFKKAPKSRRSSR